jgi:hypothetical protein
MEHLLSKIIDHVEQPDDSTLADESVWIVDDALSDPIAALQPIAFQPHQQLARTPPDELIADQSANLLDNSANLSFEGYLSE